PAPVSRADAWLKSSESDPKTEAVEAWWPVDHDKTASCSCLVQKSKNFVSRARNTPLRSVFLSAWEAKVSWARRPPAPVFAPLVEHSWTAVRHATAAAPPTETVFAELGRRARPAGLSIAGYLFLVVVNRAPVSAVAIFRVLGILRPFVPAPEPGPAGNLHARAQVVDGVEDGVVVRKFHDFTLRKHLLNDFLENVPFELAVEIVRHEKPAAQQVFAQRLRLVVREAPLAHLHGVKPRPIVGIAFVQVHDLLHGAHVQPCKPPHGQRKVPVGGREILGP